MEGSAMGSDRQFQPRSEIGTVTFVGRRIVVTGLAGAGKSTFSRALAARTGLPLIHLDAHFWRPGWLEPPEHEWREQQRELLAGDAWIADGNYAGTLDMRLARADTIVFLNTPWWICAARAFARGLRRRPAEFEFPEGCNETAGMRLRAEWRLIGAIWHNRRSECEQELAIVSQHGRHATLHTLRSKRAVYEFLEGIS
jgi:adenylate kinase family enzyme